MNHFKRNKFAALMIGTSLAAWGQAGLAEEGPRFKVSGYGTLAETITNKSDLEFRSGYGQSKGAGTRPDLGVDSRVGLQGTVDFGQGVTVVGQLLAQRERTDSTPTSNKDLDAGVEWLYAQYAVNADLDLRIGRVVLPSFMFSDTRNVGYAQPWLRAPSSVYAGMPITTLDGLQALWRIPVGDAIISIQPGYGKSPMNISLQGLVIEGTTHYVGNLNATLEWGNWLARAGQVRASLPVSLPMLAAAGVSTPVQYDLKDTFTSAGLQYDNGTALVIAEWAQRKQSELPMAPPGYSGTDLAIYNASGLGGKPLVATRSWYVAGGWRFGKWLPLLSYGEVKSTLTNIKVRNISTSVRYDLMTNVAIKGQISRYDAKDDAVFVMPAAATSSQYGDKVTVFSLGVDFVF